jgi:hypothetical protein
VAAYSAARPAWHLTLPWFAVNDPAARCRLNRAEIKSEKAVELKGDWRLITPSCFLPGKSAQARAINWSDHLNCELRRDLHG